MPKKTKKEKLLAQKHRHTVLGAPVVLYREQNAPLPTSTATFSLPQVTTQKQSGILALTNDFAVIKKDLIKSVVLIVGILLSEFLLAKLF